MKILIAEDDDVLADGLLMALEKAGYQANLVVDGELADHALTQESYDLLLLDLTLPKMDGLEVLKRLRARRDSIPVLVLTARDTLQDRVKGLDLGADDYLVKPFALPELVARTRALIRRGHFASHTELIYRNIRFDTIARRVFGNGHPLELSAKETTLLEVLLSNRGCVLSKEQLLERLYGWDDDVSVNALEVCIYRLRKKLENYGFELKSIRGLGYLLKE